MKKFFISVCFGLISVPVQAQDFTIINPPLPTRAFKHLLVVGSVPGQQWLFVYTNSFEVLRNYKKNVENADAFYGDDHWLRLKNDWQVFTANEQEANLLTEKRTAQNEDIFLWSSSEEYAHHEILPQERVHPREDKHINKKRETLPSSQRFVLIANPPLPQPDPLYKEQIGLHTAVRSPDGVITSLAIRPAKVVIIRKNLLFY